ncbi:MAG: MerR family transcriptional regulator [Rhizobiales bacterium]|nr:MerR family transcriptional regulator [Hyphomicrobiales bacterium]
MYLIGNLVDSVGMEPKTIRFYERAGLIKPRRVGTYRVYSSKDVELLKVIKFFRALDMSIKIIKDLLDRHGRLRMDSLPSEAKNAIGSQLKKRQEEYARLEKLCRPILEDEAAASDEKRDETEPFADSEASTN